MASTAQDYIEATVAETREMVQKRGATILHVNNLTGDDLDDIVWSGGPLHLKAIAKALERAKKGEVEYLAVRAPNGSPVAIGGIDYRARKDAGTLWQLVVHEQLRSLGLGSYLISEMEKRVKKRGLKQVVIGVEENNTRAWRLYRSLGYKEFSREKDSWDTQDKNGKVIQYIAQLVLLKKSLN